MSTFAAVEELTYDNSDQRCGASMSMSTELPAGEVEKWCQPPAQHLFSARLFIIVSELHRAK